MARPLKDGVEYFNKDVTFYHDDKVRMLRAEFGAKGMYMLDYILCEIYGKDGYFLKWDNSRCFLVSDGAGCGCSPEYISEFISGCIRCSFFNERVFKAFGVLTSAGIQRRYIRMFKSRDYIYIKSEYWLLDINNKKDVPESVLNKLNFITDKSTENPNKSAENPNKSTENTQSKVKAINSSKESKLNIPAEIRNEWNDYVEMRVKTRKPMTERAKQIAFNKLQDLSHGNFNVMKAILNQSVFNSWQGLFPVKGDVSNNGVNRESDAQRIAEASPYGEIL